MPAQLAPIDVWCRRFSIAAGIALCVWWLAGCAATPYWVKVRDPVQVYGVVEVERPCGKVVDGCANLATGVIELRRGLRPALRECVLTHERRHFAGYDHEVRAAFATDCGDGTLVPL